MKKYFTTVAFIFSICVSFGQTLWYSNYGFSNKILDRLSHDALNYQAAEDLSFIGEYERMLAVWDRDEKIMPADLTPEQRRQFSKYKPVNAKDYILEKAKTEQIILINEAHHQPYHRVFTTSLLHDLYKAGYRYFSAETITNYDITLKELRNNKYPTINSGYYTREPLYGNLIREAIKEGFEIFGYESTRLGSVDSAGIIVREIDQAKNIKKILDNDPKAKILIHCGYDHIVETPYRGWGKAMAGRLYEYTGINPFTIDQTILTEHSSAEYQNPYWTSLNLDYYAMFVDSCGQTFNGSQEFKKYDALVYHPRTKWLHGRPHWVFENNRTPFYLNENLSLTFPCLVFAFLTKEIQETENAIPFDIIELKTSTDKKALSLKRGQQFTIVIRDENSKEQQFNVRVE